MLTMGGNEAGWNTETLLESPEWVRFEDTRRLWRNPECRKRLIHHWLDDRHPQKQSFINHRSAIEAFLYFRGGTADLLERLKREQYQPLQLARWTPEIIESFFPSDGTIETLESQASVCHHDKNLDDSKPVSGLEAEVNILRRHHGEVRHHRL